VLVASPRVEVSLTFLQTSLLNYFSRALNFFTVSPGVKEDHCSTVPIINRNSDKVLSGTAIVDTNGALSLVCFPI
jgi:hypothetical protein